MSACRMLCSGLLVWVCGSGAHAQIVQLPTFRQFSIGTTVVVPDSGAAYLGGVSRARYSSSSRGIPMLGPAGRLARSRASSADIGASSVWATATIHDLSALDRAVLAAAEARLPRSVMDEMTRQRAIFLSKSVGKRSSRRDTPFQSVAELNARARRLIAQKPGETVER